MKTTIAAVELCTLVGMLSAATPFVPKDTLAAGGGRVHLCQYRFEVTADRLTLIGTNGNYMATMDCPCNTDLTPTARLTFGLDVHTAKVLQTLFKTAPKGQKFVTLEHDDEAKTLAFGIGGMMTPFKLAEFDHYPDWRRVVPPDNAEQSTKGRGDLFNAELLVDTFKAVHTLAKALGSKHPAGLVKILAGENGRQMMTVKASGDRCNFLAVIMGMRD